MFPRMREYARSFDKTQFMLFLIKDLELLKNKIESGIKPAIVLKKGLIVKQGLMKIKSMLLRKVLFVFVRQ